MKLPKWEKRFDEFIGRPVSGESIKNFIRNLLKDENKKKDAKQDHSEESLG